MTNHIIRRLALIMSVLVLASCGGEKDNQDCRTIHGSLNQVNSLDINLGKVIPLETTDSSLVGVITNIEEAGGRLIVETQGILETFDLTSGKYLGKIGGRGQGPGEYTNISQFWADSDTVTVLDFYTRGLIKYLADGTYISSERLFDKEGDADADISFPVYLMRLPGSEYYVSLNCFTDGTTETNPTASLYDANFNYLRDIPGRSMADGANLSDRMTSDAEGRRLLMWEGYKDTLFTIDGESVRPWLTFDFGENSFPQEYHENPDMFQRAMIFNNDKTAPYLSNLRWYQKYGNILFFSASTPDDSNYLGRVDLKDYTLRLFRLTDPSGRYKSGKTMKIIAGKLYLELTDTESDEANPSLLAINPDLIK